MTNRDYFFHARYHTANRWWSLSALFTLFFLASTADRSEPFANFAKRQNLPLWEPFPSENVNNCE